MAVQQKDIPLIPVTILKKKYGKKMIIGEGKTYNQRAEEAGKKLRAKDVTALLGDAVAQNHHPSVRAKWLEEDRPKFLAT